MEDRVGRGGERRHWQVTEKGREEGEMVHRKRQGLHKQLSLPGRMPVWLRPPLTAALVQPSSSLLGLWRHVLTGLLANRPSSALPSIELSDRHDRWLSFSR